MHRFQHLCRVQVIAGLAALLLSADALAQSPHRMYLGTGEFDPVPSWDGILIFDRADLINGNQSPDRLVDFKTAGGNFPHMLAYRESSDELYVTSLFTEEILIFSSASTMSSGATPTRMISGVSTSLNQPHGLWIDESRDLLYVASRFDATGSAPGNVLVWANASTVSGPVAPTIIGGPVNTGLAQPFNVFIDEANDVLYVASANDNGVSSDPAIVVFNNASTLSGDVPYDRKIAGPLTTFASHQTVHNVILDSVHNDLYVAHHQSDVLVFSPGDTATGDISPARTLTGFKNVLGLFYIPSEDTLYVSDAAEGPPDCGGGPCTGSPPQSIKVFLSASTLNGAVASTPDRIIYYDPEGNTYFPPQPIWVQLLPEEVPAVSQWGLAVLAALVLIAGIYLGRRRAV